MPLWSMVYRGNNYMIHRSWARNKQEVLVKKIIQIVLIGAIGLSLSGCNRIFISQNSNADPSKVELSEAAVAVNQSVQDLYAVTAQVTPLQIKEQAPNPVSYGMGRLASVDWAGPIEPLVEELGEITHYRVKSYGKAPTIPVIVMVSKREVPVGDILREVSLQARDQVRIVIYPENHLIEMEYL